MDPTEAWHTGADVGVDVIRTYSTVLTRVGATLVHLHLTVGASIAPTAHTRVLVYLVETSASVHTGIWEAVVVVNLAVPSLEAHPTATVEGAD